MLLEDGMNEFIKRNLENESNGVDIIARGLYRTREGNRIILLQTAFDPRRFNLEVFEKQKEKFLEERAKAEGKGEELIFNWILYRNNSYKAEDRNLGFLLPTPLKKVRGKGEYKRTKTFRLPDDIRSLRNVERGIDRKQGLFDFLDKVLYFNHTSSYGPCLEITTVSKHIVSYEDVCAQLREDEICPVYNRTKNYDSCIIEYECPYYATPIGDATAKRYRKANVKYADYFTDGTFEFVPMENRKEICIPKFTKEEEKKRFEKHLGALDGYHFTERK